jgi:hypothetical protein
MWCGGGCVTCTPPPGERATGAVALSIEASVLVEDGSAQAECWADGEPAWRVLGLWRGERDGAHGAALAALARRHGRLTARAAWVHPDEWDGSAAAGMEVRGRAARTLGVIEAEPVVAVMQRALMQPAFVVCGAVRGPADVSSFTTHSRRCAIFSLCARSYGRHACMIAWMAPLPARLPAPTCLWWTQQRRRRRPEQEAACA